MINWKQRIDYHRQVSANGFIPVLPLRPRPATAKEHTYGMHVNGLAYDRVQCPHCEKNYPVRWLRYMKAHIETHHGKEWKKE